jgi:hypothetical protein
LPRHVLEVDHLHALGAMGSTWFAHSGNLFEYGLNLLVRQLGVDRAMVASLNGRELETLWCAGAAPMLPGGVPTAINPDVCYCPQVLRRPETTLVIADAALDPQWRAHSAWQSLGIRAYIGAPLRGSGRPMGVLSVQCDAARAWQPSEVALVNVMACLLGNAMEVECLKMEISKLQAHLELTAAVVEDQALESPSTGLPSMHYLDVWCRSNLVLARRRREIIALATWRQPPAPGRNELLKQLAGSLRGVDVLVDLGRDRFLLVLPRTSKAGAEMVLERVREALGPRPMGATLWNPLLNPDRNAPTLQPAVRRAQAAEPVPVEPGSAGADHGEVAWSIVEPDRASFLEGAGEW